MRTRRRRGRIPPRTRVYLGCEGRSEVGYGQRLQDLANDSGLHIYIDTDDLSTGATEPQGRLRRAIDQITRKEATRSGYRYKAVIMDFDQVQDTAALLDRITREAATHNIHLIWQRPCHEALLLRHLPDCVNLQPPTTANALARLRQVWPEYSKGMSRAQLSHRIGIEEVRQAATVEVDLREFLRIISATTLLP